MRTLFLEEQEMIFQFSVLAERCHLTYVRLGNIDSIK